MRPKDIPVWLLEAPGHPGLYHAKKPRYTGKLGEQEEICTWSRQEAMQFATKADAQRFACSGCGSDAPWVATEHIFVSPMTPTKPTTGAENPNQESAFPYPPNDCFTDFRSNGSSGMELRDWFAGLALQGMCANGNEQTWPPDAQAAYSFADKMMEARQHAQQPASGAGEGSK